MAAFFEHSGGRREDPGGPLAASTYPSRVIGFLRRIRPAPFGPAVNDAADELTMKIGLSQAEASGSQTPGGARRAARKQERQRSRQAGAFACYPRAPLASASRE